MEPAQDYRGGVILLDACAGEGRFDQSILERLGHRVIACDGPQQGTLCPLLAGDGCEKFEAAHGVVFEFDLDRAQHRAILDRYRQIAPDVPIRVVVSREQQAKYADLLSQVEVWDHSPSVADLDGFAAEVEASDRYR